MRRGRLAFLITAMLVTSSFILSFPPRSVIGQACTPQTCQEIYPVIPTVGYAPVQDNPQSPVFAGDMYVVNSGSNTVSVIQGMTNIGNVSVGKAPLEPAVDTDTGNVYVPNTADGTVTVISGVGVIGTVQVGSVPLTPAFDPANGEVYVSNSGGCTMNNQASNCGDTVTAISGTTVNATITVGMGPGQPGVNTDPGSQYYGFVYVASSIADQNGNYSLSVISPATNKVVATISLGFDPVPGIFFDQENDYLYAGNYVIDGTTEVASMTVGCTASSCVLDPTNGNVYEVGGSTLFVISGTSSNSVYCPPCGSYLTYNPVNDWLYAGWAVSGNMPFSTLGFSTEASGVHDSYSFNPDTGNVYASCGGCYYSSNGNGQKFGNVVFVMGNTCGQPGQGYYYNDTYAAICSGAGPQIVTNQQVNNADTGLPEVLGGHVFSLQVDAVALATGRWNATSVNSSTSGGEGKISFMVTGASGTTGYATIKILKTFVSVNLLAQLFGGSSAPSSSFKEVPTLYIDGEPVKVFAWTADSEYFYVTFRCHFSSHIVTIAFSSPGGSTGGVNSSSSSQSSSQASSEESSAASSTGPSSQSQSSSSAGSGSSFPTLYLVAIPVVLLLVVAAAIFLRRKPRS